MSEAITKYRAELWSQWKEARALREHSDKADVVAEAHGITDRSIIKWVCEKPFVCLKMDVKSFDEALPVLRDLAKLGYRTNKDEPFQDYHEIQRRTYNLGPIRLMLFLREEGTCRRVQVGVKEEPIYEFVCD